ncbi:MAG: superoxide dismutase [Desulfarculus sp.]|nr:MAG: superoxide dismutase [Desulfarculus sp.]
MPRRQFLFTAAAGAAALGLGLPGLARAGQFKLPPLPWPQKALEPYISARTISFHYGKHHASYVNNLNRLIQGTPFAKLKLEEIIKASYGNNDAAFNNAAQVWNHTFYWQSMKPGGGGQPSGELAAKIKAGFGSMQACLDQLLKAAAARFGSGWAWLVVKDGRLVVVSSSNALNPLVEGMRPLLTVDVWEHAYYLDYQNRRADYLKAWAQHLVNWEFAAKNLGM